MNVEEDYVSFEVAKLLKKEGFTWNYIDILTKTCTPGVSMTIDNSFPCYNEEGKPVRPRKYTDTNSHYPRPSLTIARKWIIENYGLNVESYWDGWNETKENRWSYSVVGIEKSTGYGVHYEPDTEYKTEQDCLNDGLEFVLNRYKRYIK